MDMYKENQETMAITDTAQSTELNVLTSAKVKINGIEYAPEYTSEGLKIPICVYDHGTKVYSCYYQLIPRYELKSMLLDMIPEIVREYPDIFSKP